MRYLYYFIVFFLLFTIIKINLDLYSYPKFSYDKITNQIYNQDVYYQLQHLRSEIEYDSDIEIQKIYPEGYVFFNSLYCLTWVDLIRYLDTNAVIYKEGIKEISTTLLKLKSD